LCISALLAVLDVPTQLYSHLRGALNVGASPEEVEHALRIAADVSTVDACGHAQDTWRAVRERLQQPSSEMS
jgi:alkylhydroperoxidase/carboxymuconolactone decarboxylase family protein YurZ